MQDKAHKLLRCEICEQMGMCRHELPASGMTNIMVYAG